MIPCSVILKMRCIGYIASVSVHMLSERSIVLFLFVQLFLFKLLDFKFLE